MSTLISYKVARDVRSPETLSRARPRRTPGRGRSQIDRSDAPLWRLGSQYLCDRLVADAGFRLRARRNPAAAVADLIDRSTTIVNPSRATKRQRPPDQKALPDPLPASDNDSGQL